MPASLATTTPNVPTMTADRVHQVRLGGRGFWKCYAKGCSFAPTESMPEAIAHVSQRQWVATPNLPPELELTAEQEAA